MMSLIVSEEQARQRLDIYVTANMPQVSRAFIQRLCDTAEILVNGTQVKAGYKLKKGDKVSVDYDPKKPEEIPDIKLPIIYEDDDCLVINKPVGLLTHSKGEFNPEPTVASFLRRYVKGLDGSRAGIVHRLDRATSGVMICARNSEALSWLQKQFSQRRVKKTYVAIVQGSMREEEALIDMPIERNPKAPATFRVGANGKTAKTHYKVLSVKNGKSLLELSPMTGRTHQLRVHLNQLGHPIVGDTIYGGQIADRLYLHALRVEITLPNRERRTFEAELPIDFERTME